MLRTQLLTALDSPLPLLFLEAVHGSGKRTVLTQWEQRGHGRYGEIRLLFDADRLPTEPADLLRMFWPVLRKRLEMSLPQLPEDDVQLGTIVMRHLREIRRPVAVAVLSADRLPTRTLSIILRLLDVGFRLVLAGSDLSEPLRLARERGLYFTQLDDRQIALTFAEVRELMEEQGLEPDDEAVAALYRASQGHPGLAATALRSLREECAAGAISRDRVVGAFLAELPMDRWPTDTVEVLRPLVQLPRCTARQAALVTGRPEVGRTIERLRALGVGEMTWYPGLQERVFQWSEPVRQVVQRFLPTGPRTEAETIETVIRAARTTHDDELLVAGLVKAGDLDQAEALLREQLWDLLPNAAAPLWAPLERIDPMDLLDRPALLIARLRLGPQRSRSPVSLRAAQLAGRALMGKVADDPWTRVGNLACAIKFALYAGEREQLIDRYTRVRDLIEDLATAETASTVTARAISDQLLIAEAVFRSGNAIPAAEIAGFVLQLLEGDLGRRDPRGERRPFARRLVLHDHRARGLEDPFDPAPLLAGAQFLWRDADQVVAAMTMMWEDFDHGDAVLADSRLRIATERVADPEAWPVLMFMRAHLAVHRRSLGELEVYARAYERSTLSVPGRFAQQSLSEMQRLTDYLSSKLGRQIASPGFLPAVPEPGRTFYPRTEFTVQLMEALYAVRAKRPAVARAALGQAVALAPRRRLGVYTLANASEAEVRELLDLAEEVPGGSGLGLERALPFAGALHRPLIDLSEREREVLEHLRDGATNPQMARALFVSVNTVKFHRANLMRKLDASDRSGLLEAADRLGL